MENVSFGMSAGDVDNSALVTVSVGLLLEFKTTNAD